MRLIDADALMAHFAELQKVKPDKNGREYSCNFRSSGGEQAAEWYTIEDAVDNAPTIDAVPVVRCRKCKIKSECMEYEIKKNDDFFCGYGERKENNNNE